MSDTSPPQAGSMAEMDVTGADLLRSGNSGSSTIGSQHKQQGPIKSAGDPVGSSAKPQRSAEGTCAPRDQSALLQTSVPPALELDFAARVRRRRRLRREDSRSSCCWCPAHSDGWGQAPVSDTSPPQAGSMAEMDVTGADLLRSGNSGSSTIGSQHKQQGPIKSAGGPVGSSAKPQRSAEGTCAPRDQSALLQASVPPALELDFAARVRRRRRVRRDDSRSSCCWCPAHSDGRGQAPVSDTSPPQAGSMAEMDVTGADLLRSGNSGSSTIGSQHKQQGPIKSAGGPVGSSAKPQRSAEGTCAPRDQSTALLQASVPPALELDFAARVRRRRRLRREDSRSSCCWCPAHSDGRGQAPVSDTSPPQAGSMAEMDVTGADLLRSGNSGSSTIGSQHKQQGPIKSAGGPVGSSAKPQRSAEGP